MIEKIISGGQFGADMGGLLGASDLDIKTGGTAPHGWLTEKGKQPELLESFGLVEGPFDPKWYIKRTMLNVDDSDGTIAFRLKYSVGTDATIGYALSKRWDRTINFESQTKYKPVYILETLSRVDIISIKNWIEENNIKVLNVAGHRESVVPGIQEKVRLIIRTALV